MAFDKAYFENLREDIETYRRTFSVSGLTMTIRLYGGEDEFNIDRLLKIGDSLLPFAYYNSKKQQKSSDKVRAETGEPTALPALTVSYSDIRWVELKPGNAVRGAHAGF